MRLLPSCLVLTISLIAGAAVSQQTSIPFGSDQHDATQQVEITSDVFRISQKNRSVVFSGNVLIGQGELQIAAGEVLVIYADSEDENNGQIEKLTATGGVTLVAGAEAAEADAAVYTIDTGNIVMTGNVLLTQGNNAVSGQILTINLGTGFAQIEGRVKTIFNTGSSD